MSRAVEQWPSAALCMPCAEVAHGDDVSRLINEMLRAMNFPRGIGLAANQLGENLRIIVVQLNSGWHLELINPVITWMSPSREALGKEGCLSVPGQMLWVPRNRHIKVRGFDRDWNPVIAGGKNLRARVLQHEIDHLNGVCMVQRAVVPSEWAARASGTGPDNKESR